jgi:hypothetical protein
VLAVIAFNLTRTAATLTGPTLAKATTATIRRKLIRDPARAARRARQLTLHLPEAGHGPDAWSDSRSPPAHRHLQHKPDRQARGHNRNTDVEPLTARSGERRRIHPPTPRSTPPDPSGQHIGGSRVARVRPTVIRHCLCCKATNGRNLAIVPDSYRAPSHAWCIGIAERPTPGRIKPVAVCLRSR